MDVTPVPIATFVEGAFEASTADERGRMMIEDMKGVVRQTHKAGGALNPFLVVQDEF